MKMKHLYNPGIKHPHRIILLTILLACTALFMGAMAQTISDSTSLIISPGTTVTTDNSTTVLSGGTLDVQGTLIVKQNFINLSSNDSLGSGTIEFSGTTPQSISGTNTIANLRINNAAGVTIAGATTVYGELKLKNGLLTLGTYDLVRGTAATDSGGSATSMIIQSGSGAFRKMFSTTPAFPLAVTFPVGTGTSEYSPVTLTFASGTFASGSYAEVSVDNAKYPDANITGNYLNRYWTVTQNGGVSNFNCTATFQYADGDIVGTEGNLFCLKTTPIPFITYDAVNAASNLLTAPGLSSFSSFTGAMGAHEANLTAFLEGPYNAGAMNTTLNTSALIPLSQPYNVSPWSYAGTEAVVGTIPSGVVDWVLIELRQASTPANATAATIIQKRAAFITSTGAIVDLDGTSPVRFYNANITQNLYPVIKHRNHVSIMANNAVTKVNDIYSFNYTTGSGQVYGGVNGTKQIATGVWGLIVGDADADGSVFNSDFNQWRVDFGFTGSYKSTDFDFDTNVFNSDFNIWRTNFGYQTQVPN
jgi:hypothetical protein